MRPVIIIFSLILLQASCGARLNHERKINTPQSSGELTQAIDTSKLIFYDLVSAETINLKTYMQINKIDSILLFFGSVGCTTCGRKANLIRDTVIGKSDLLATSGDKKFVIVGINTDRASSRQAVLRYRKEHRYEFIKWSDPAGDMMLKHLMPPGDPYSVPLTALISTDGIMWRYTSKESYTIPTLMERVSQSLTKRWGLKTKPQIATVPLGNKTDANNQPSRGSPPVLQTQLAKTAPGRLGEIALETCQGKTTDLESVFKGRSLRIFTVDRDNCSSPQCQSNAQEMARVNTQCSLSKDCAAVIISTRIQNGTCENGLHFKGGSAFFKVFASFFNWSYMPQEFSDGHLELPPVAGPLTFAMTASGELLYGVEGVVSAGSLARQVKDRNWQGTATGPNFKFYGLGRGPIEFSDVRQRADFTIVNNFRWDCTGCIDELQRWSKPDGLIDQCHAKPGRCQLLGLDDGEPSVGQSFDQYLDWLVNGGRSDPLWTGLRSKGITIPIMIDPTPASGQGYLKRFYSGYLLASFRDWISYGTVIYDREGKIRGGFAADAMQGDEEAIVVALRHLLEE